MKKIEVTIEGTAPLLMNKLNPEDLMKKSRQITREYNSKEEAEKSAYWKKDKKELCIPSEIIYASLIRASSFYKIGKKSASSIIAGSIRIEPFEIGLGANKYVVDTRAVVVQRAKILRSRARIDKWKATFNIHYNEKLIPEPEVLKQVLTEAGERIGIMDFRPSKRGPFGTFKITKWQS